jgi:hypothetical protein
MRLWELRRKALYALSAGMSPSAPAMPSGGAAEAVATHKTVFFIAHSLEEAC